MIIDNYHTIVMEQNPVGSPGNLGDYCQKDSVRVIYCLTFPNGKKYIGQTKNINRRFLDYKYNCVKGQHKVYNAIKKYGFDNIVFEILEDSLSLDHANYLEKYYIKFYSSADDGYNISRGGNSSPTEREEVKQKLRDYNALPETKARKSAEMKKRMQDPVFKEFALSSSKKPEALEKHRVHFKKLIQTEDFKKKQADAEEKRLEKLRTPEHRKMLSDRAKKQFLDGKLPAGKKKPVICIETNEIFDSLSAVIKKYGGRLSHLSRHLSGEKWRKKFKGLHFKLVESNKDVL